MNLPLGSQLPHDLLREVSTGWFARVVITRVEAGRIKETLPQLFALRQALLLAHKENPVRFESVTGL